MAAWFDCLRPFLLYWRNRCSTVPCSKADQRLTRGFLFLLLKKTFLWIIFSVTFKSVQTSTCWQKKLFTSEFKFRTNTARLGYLNPALNKKQTVDEVLVEIIIKYWEFLM